MNNREIDALIAEKVMNLKLDYEFADVLGAPTVPALRDQYDEWGMLPEFSTDISDAWQVYEWLESRGLVTVCNGDGDSKDCDFTPLQTWNHPSGEFCLESAHVSAESYPMAICLAALKAVGVEEEE